VSGGLYLGIDVGSISVKAVVCDGAGAIVEHRYTRHSGLPYDVTLEMLRELFGRCAPAAFRGIGVTGAGGEKLAELLDCRFVNEIVAQSRAAIARTPHVRTVIEMGGQDSKLLIFEPDDRTGRPVLRDFSMNALCAAGTGSFLDQQASRLGVSIEEEFGHLALQCKHPPHMAGRCSVFAKSDMIHLQQIATPVQDIVAGLCFALARNFRSTIGQGKSFAAPIGFQGGVASNAGMRRAFEEVLELDEGALVVDRHHKVTGALGAALVLLDEQAETAVCSLSALERHIRSETTSAPGLEPLAGALTQQVQPPPAPPLAGYPVYRDGFGVQPSGCPSIAHHTLKCELQSERLDVFLGIDVGSVSTNVVLIDREGRLLAKRYLPTAGRPIEAVRRGIEEIYQEVGDRVVVRGCATTGSGRYLIGDLVGADLIRNEITAQATAAIAIDPTVDTIFEIGGQDSKYVGIKDGAVCDFEMNKACAAGTGSFLEEQAERLGMRIEEEFAERALASQNPVALGDRCTVFMESDLLHHQQAGASKEDLVAGLAYSIVYNYLNRVVGDRQIGKRVFFQGGTAFNRAVVAAFNRVLGRPVVVPPHHEVTGAIGVALLARDYTEGASKFKGFDWSNREYRVETFLCNKCANSCEIRRVQMANDRPLFYGSRCERFDVDRGRRNEHIPDLFAERTARLRACLDRDDFPPATRGRVAIPLTLIFNESLPLWATFFRALGFEVILSGDTSKAIVNEGIERVVAETCYPIKVAHGHVAALLERDVDFIFLPGVINAPTPEYGAGERWNFNCPFVQTIPYMVKAAFGADLAPERLFSPALHMQRGMRGVFKVLASERSRLRSPSREIRRALRRGYEAQEQFDKWLVERGRQILETLPDDAKALVIVGRPYNAFDTAMCLDIPKKLRNLGVLAIPMDMLALDEVRLPTEWRRMYWRSGQRILKAAEIVRRDPRLFAVYITNFSCGPDSFLLNFFNHSSGTKPHLQIEIDEHSADAGIITRCEAFLDTLVNHKRSDAEEKGPVFGLYMRTYTDHRKVYLPNMSAHAYALAAAMRRGGLQAEVMAESDAETIALGRKHTSGKECFPALLTAGDMIRQIKRDDFDPTRSAFFMGASDGPCRFGQYNTLHRLILDDLGLRDVPLYVVDQDDSFWKDIAVAGGREFERTAWLGICAIDIFERLVLSTRPYELNRGETDQWFHRSVRAVCDALEAGRSIAGILREARRQYEQIETANRGARSLIAVVGELYVRANRFANDNLVSQIEQLGGEAVVPAMTEWFHYCRVSRGLHCWRDREIGQFFNNTLRGAYQVRLERRLYKRFGAKTDPPVTELLELARPYLDPSFEGEAVLTIGKSLELFHTRAIAGVINTMPFTCMPGTVVSSLIKRVREDCHGLPIVTMVYTGQQNLANRIRLEAFMHQARAFHKGGRQKAKGKSKKFRSKK